MPRWGTPVGWIPEKTRPPPVGSWVDKKKKQSDKFCLSLMILFDLFNSVWSCCLNKPGKDKHWREKKELAKGAKAEKKEEKK